MMPLNLGSGDDTRNTGPGMSVSFGVFFHITTGSFALLSGTGAMAFRKGSPPHRVAGTVFALSMLATAGSAIYLAGFVHPTMPALIEGLLAFYLTATAWQTVLRPERTIDASNYVTLCIGLATVAAGVAIGLEAANSPKGLKEGIPAAIFYAFAAIAALGAIFDMIVIANNGIAGKQRIVRHLWRMTTAFFLAVANFFAGNGSKIFPAEIVQTKVLLAPVAITFALLIFWTIRVRFTKWYKEA
jgi:uncharacterized membrane protein